MHRYQIFLPNWLKVELNKKREAYYAGLKRDGEKSPDTNSKHQKVTNDNVDSLCKLKTKESVKWFFHQDNIKDLTCPSVNDEPLCLKFHTDGKCDNKCPKKATHVDLPHPTTISLCEFVKKVRVNYDNFQKNKKGKKDKE